MATVHHALMDRRIAYKEMEDRIGAAGAERQRRNRTTPGEMQRYRNAATVAANLATPWEALLESLERAPTQNVALLSIEPVASERLLRLAAEAKDLYAMLDYLAYLQGAPGLHHAILVSHQVQTQQPGSPVKFQIQAQWGAQGDAP